MLNNDVIVVQKTKITPEVKYDNGDNSANVTGESCPENAIAFYRPLMEWVRSRISKDRSLLLQFEYTYFNTTTTKQLIELFDMLDAYYRDGYDVFVAWYCPKNDTDMEEVGEELLEDMYFPYKIYKG